MTAEELDRLLGLGAHHADESFNAILELGFASSIRKEWEWRKLRGESTRNLEAFRGWLESGERRPRGHLGGAARHGCGSARRAGRHAPGRRGSAG